MQVMLTRVQPIRWESVVFLQIISQRPCMHEARANAWNPVQLIVTIRIRWHMDRRAVIRSDYNRYIRSSVINEMKARHSQSHICRLITIRRISYFKHIPVHHNAGVTVII